MHTLRVSNVMSRRLNFVSSNDTLESASEKIFGRKLSGLPVCKDEKVIGFISGLDILAAVTPIFKEAYSKSKPKPEESKIENFFKIKVKDVMHKDVKTIKADAPLFDAQKIMFKYKFYVLPVVDDNKKLVGMITNNDIFRSLVKERFIDDVDEEYNDWLSKNYYQTVDIENRMSYELPDMLSLFKKHKVKSVLDIGCGTGDHLIALAKEGYEVTGIDRSEMMIDEARKRIDQLPKHIKKHIHLTSGEYISLSRDKLKKTFDCVMIWGNTLSHNPYTYQKILDISSDLLTGPSLLIIQNTNFEKILKEKKRFQSLIFVDKDSYESTGDEHAFLEFYDKPDEEEMTILKTFAVLDKTQNKWSPYGTKNSIFAFITKMGIERYLLSLGFKEIHFYGSSFDGRSWDYVFRQPFSPLESDWMNIVAVKR